jgi:hypothetical protein
MGNFFHFHHSLSFLYLYIMQFPCQSRKYFFVGFPREKRYDIFCACILSVAFCNTV